MKIYPGLLSLLLVAFLFVLIPAQDARRRSAIDYYNRANDWQKQGRLDQALTDYSFALTFDATLAQAWNNRGVVHYLKSEYEAAIADCSKALELKADYAEALAQQPQQAEIYFNRGNLWMKREAWDKANFDYTRALELNPRLALAWNNRGNVNFIRQKLEAAFADYSRALELDPQYASAYFNRGVVLLKLERAAEAEQDFVKGRALTKEPLPEVEQRISAAQRVYALRKQLVSNSN